VELATALGDQSSPSNPSCSTASSKLSGYLSKKSHLANDIQLEYKDGYPELPTSLDRRPQPELPQAA
jgi:hypothetical protein